VFDIDVAFSIVVLKMGLRKTLLVAVLNCWFKKIYVWLKLL
jgi:hypothetical protein